MPERDDTRGRPQRLILLAPIAPAPTGNGLAMRADLFRRAAAREFDVHTVVTPVAGRLPSGVAGACDAKVVNPDAERARAGAMLLLADATWRDRLMLAEALPARARLASPGLAGAVADAIAVPPPVAIHVMRSYLAPLGVALAERLGASPITIDLDEDDLAISTELGDLREAAAYHRLLTTFGPLFDGLAAASAAEAAAISARTQLVIEQIPNAVGVPPASARRGRQRGASVLFVGNLTYQPNYEAAATLVERVLPELRRCTAQPVQVTLVGPHSASLKRLAGDHVEMTGFVTDLGPAYAAADVTIIPLRWGAGTRIKILEAFAHQLPVVASSTAAAGLAVTDRRHLLLADEPASMAAAAARICTDPALAEMLARNGYDLVRARYSTEVVVPAIGAFFAASARRARRPAEAARVS